MNIGKAQRAILEVIERSAGRWHFKDIDYWYWGHPDASDDIDLLTEIKELVDSGHLFAEHEVSSSRSWVLTALGDAEVEPNRLPNLVRGMMSSEDPTRWSKTHDRISYRLVRAPDDRKPVGEVEVASALLMWADLAASRAVSTGDRTLIRSALTALALTEQSALIDREWVAGAAGIVRRSMETLGLEQLEYVDSVVRLPFFKNSSGILAWFNDS